MKKIIARYGGAIWLECGHAWTRKVSPNDTEASCPKCDEPHGIGCYCPECH